ncbi:MAG: hypothetical protein ACK4YP_09230 [Myxococcota bacterium]
MKRALLPLLLLAVGCSAAQEDMGWLAPEDDVGIAAGTLRLDVTPPASVANGTLLGQSHIVLPDAYEGVNVELLPTRTVSGTLTAQVARGWSFGPPTTIEPLPATLLALPGAGLASGAAQSGDDGFFTLTYPAYPGRTQVAIVPTDASMAPMRVVAAPTADTATWDQLIPTGIPVYGRVVGEVDGLEEPLAGVRMRLSREAGDGTLTSGVFTTDATGWYVARVDEIGEYTLEVVGGPITDEALITPSLSLPVLVEDETGVEVPVGLGNVENAAVEGVVVDGNGERFPDARVRFTSVELEGGPGSLVIETDASGDGDFLTSFLLPGTYDIDVMPPFSPDGVLASPVRHENVRVTDGADLGNLGVGAATVLEGQVFRADAGIAGDVLVVATEIGFGGNVYHGRTDQSGRFSLDVPDVPLLVAFTPSTPGDGAVTHLAVEDPGAALALQLDPGVLVTGVLTYEGAPVAYGSVDVYDAGSNLLLGQAFSDEDGNFSLRVSVPEPAEDADADTELESPDTGDTGAEDTGADTGAEDTGDTADTAAREDSGAP